jgi:uncharacterized protein YndB with AHSA1/START domain
MKLFYRKVHASAEFHCPIQVVFEALTDYDNYRDWFPHVTSSALAAQAGEVAIALLDLALPYKGQVALESVHTVDKSVVSRVLNAGSGAETIEWELEEPAEGYSRVTLTIEGHAALPLGSRRLGVLDAPRMLAALRSYINVFGSGAADGDDGELLLEIRETENGLTCWWKGQEYEMKPRIRRLP